MNRINNMFGESKKDWDRWLSAMILCYVFETQRVIPTEDKEFMQELFILTHGDLPDEAAQRLITMRLQ